MHDIQKHILSVLSISSPRRYSELKPKQIEGNVFMYHLRRIICEGLLEKRAGLYALSTKGMQYVDTLSGSTLLPRIQPKIVTQIVYRNDRGEWLIVQRKREPLKGFWCFPYGKIHLGEMVAEAARREFLEKTGLTAQVVHRGEMYVAIYHGKELISHMLAHIFVASDVSGTPKDECHWLGNIPIINDLMPGFSELVKLLETNEPIFAEYSFQV